MGFFFPSQLSTVFFPFAITSLLGEVIAETTPRVNEESWILTSSPGGEVSPHGLANLSLKAAQAELPQVGTPRSSRLESQPGGLETYYLALPYTACSARDTGH